MYLPDFLSSECSLREPDQALFHIIPVPLEQTVSYGGGTARGPAAILEASQQLEAWDGASEPHVLGIHTQAPVDCSGSMDQVLGRIRSTVASVVKQQRIPVTLGGEHSVTIGALCGITAADKNIGLVQLDAHADLRETYQGSRLSHACVARRAVADLGMPLFQFGVRAMSVEEVKSRQRYKVRSLDAQQLYREGFPAALLPEDFPKKIYITLDVDGFDPSVIRATGTPVPGGPSWFQVMQFLDLVIRGRQVVGFDVVELAPQEHDPASDFAAAQLIYNTMGFIQRLTLDK
nr:agmatinase [Desulfogranum japonicum]